MDHHGLFYIEIFKLTIFLILCYQFAMPYSLKLLVCKRTTLSLVTSNVTQYKKLHGEHFKQKFKCFFSLSYVLKWWNWHLWWAWSGGRWCSNQQPKILRNKYILILRIPITLTIGSCVDFGSYASKDLDSCEICIWNSTKHVLVRCNFMSNANDDHLTSL